MLQKDSTLELKSVTLLDLNEDCLRHIGNYLSIEDTYSLGHTCTQLLGTVSKMRSIVTITNPNELKYLDYFGQEARTINVDTKDTTHDFTENEESYLLTIMENCTKITNLKLRTSNSRILGSALGSIRSIRKLVYLRIYLMELPVFNGRNFVESMRNCENLRDLTIEYDNSIDFRSSDAVKEILTTEFPKLKSVRFVALDSNGPDNPYFMPVNTFLRHNRQLKFLEVNGPLSQECLEAIVLCRKLEKLELAILTEEENWIPKLLILNKLPVLEHTILAIDIGDM